MFDKLKALTSFTLLASLPCFANAVTESEYQQVIFSEVASGETSENITQTEIDDALVEVYWGNNYSNNEILRFKSDGLGNLNIATLFGVKDLFSLLPKQQDGKQLEIISASLRLVSLSNTANNETISITNVTTPWLHNAAGENEGNITGAYSDISNQAGWSNGEQANGNTGTIFHPNKDTDTSSKITHQWQAGWQVENRIDITPLIQETYETESNQGIALYFSGNVNKDLHSIKSSDSTAEDPALTPQLIIDYQYVSVSKEEKIFDAFTAFKTEYFGAEKEPLAYEKFGHTLNFVATGEYLHASENSAFITTESNLPAIASIRYGLEGELDHEITLSDQTYLHQFHLPELQNNQTYFYQITLRDERGSTIESAVETFSTGVSSYTSIAGGHLTAPITLSKSGYYLLTGDITADYTAFIIDASNVILDLNGHTITYNEIDHQVDSDYYNTASYGIYGQWKSNINIYNGTIQQGAGNNTAYVTTVGYNPILLRTVHGGEIAGIKTIYSGAQVTGILLRDASSTDIDIHHNQIIDKGYTITNRHQGVKGIQAGQSAHHNLITRARHMGISVSKDGGAVHSNEIYIDSFATNSFGIFNWSVSDIDFYKNKVFGGGYMMVGIGASSDADNVNIYDNFVHLQSTEPSFRWDEYNARSRVVGIRNWGENDKYPDNLHVNNNIVTVNAKQGGDARGLWLFGLTNGSTNVIENNTVTMMLEDTPQETGLDFGALVLTGEDVPYGDDSAPLLLKNNYVKTNFRHIVLGHDYGHSRNSVFDSNTFERISSRDDYNLIQIGYWIYDISGHRLYDSTFLGNTNYDYVLDWSTNPEGKQEFYAGWSLTINTNNNAQIRVFDENSTEIATLSTDENGYAKVLLDEFKQATGVRTYSDTYYVEIQKSGYQTWSGSVEINQPKNLQITLTQE